MLFRFKKDIKALNTLITISEDINRLADIDSVLDKVLLEARRFTNADAGSIYLIEGNKLRFRYVQNDSLFKNDQLYNQYLYADNELPIDENSIAGYVALTGKSVKLDNAYKIRKQFPFSFNRSFDETAGYTTKSVLTVPLKTGKKEVLGVLQIINAKHGEKSVPFTEKDSLYVTYFGDNAAIAIEKAKLTRDMVLRMIKMSQLRDPHETAPHVNRVGAYSVEIYHRWALRNGISLDEIKRQKDILRIAAMLHDAGKVAISDTILKKPAKLTPEEFTAMKYHTIYGARLFHPFSTPWDSLTFEVALTHHERWDGKGYPGKIDNVFDESIKMNSGIKDNMIPIFGRIVALADVYDALITKRVYKDAWPEEDVLTYINQQSGKQFDPDLVYVFFIIYDVIKAIRARYVD
ncbi:MAG: HD domain-containing protein [Spirochaetes bacterium]|nr:HD domain-containing protein [Spirochaetota bacterium]